MKKILINNYLKVSIRILFTFLIGISLLQAEKKRAFLELISTESCPYCVAAKRLLKGRGLTYQEFNFDEDPSFRIAVI